MNILLIGNGFDLAHGLPTKYTDFLEFVKKIKIIKEENIFNDGSAISKAGCNVNNKKLHQFIQLIILNKADNKELERDSKELLDCIDNNFWIDYFLQCDMHGNENWIDFESEISEVIKSFDRDMHNSIKEIDLYDEIAIRFSSDFLDTYEKFESCDTYKQIRDILENDLNALIRALEIYLTEFVEKIECKFVSPDIKDAIEKSGKCMIKGTEVYICNVICFNYTNTYEKIYLKCSTTRNLINYIHGQSDIKNTIESNNMVLGIDEYLPKKRRNKETEFIAFKKFYQRIHKQTGCEYREWINKIIQENNEYKENLRQNQLDYERNRGMGNEGYQTKMNLKHLKEKLPKHNLFIFGHSLDVTDKDILRDLILNDNVHTTIFYHNKDVMGQQIANLVKVIGQDELIRRTGGSTKTIEFKQQQDMKEIPQNEI